jgi:hypothetical protein
MRFRFTPALEQLGDRVNPSTLATAPFDVWDYTPTMTRQITIVEDLSEDGEHRTTLEGQECLVFFLGGIPSAEPVDVPKYWVFGTEVPGGSSGTTVPRRNLVTLHSADLNNDGLITFRDQVVSLAGGADQVQQGLFIAKQLSLRDRAPYGIRLVFDESERAGPFFNFTSSRLRHDSGNNPADYGGTHILYQDVVIPQADPYVFALDARASGM